VAQPNVLLVFFIRVLGVENEHVGSLKEIRPASTAGRRPGTGSMRMGSIGSAAFNFRGSNGSLSGRNAIEPFLGEKPVAGADARMIQETRVTRTSPIETSSFLSS